MGKKLYLAVTIKL